MTATCPGAPAGFEADCGQAGPHGPHPLGQLLPEPAPPLVHPDWCWTSTCTAAAGGAHRSRGRIVPEPDRLLEVELIQVVDRPAEVMVIAEGSRVLRLTLAGAQTLAAAVRELARIAQRPAR